MPSWIKRDAVFLLLAGVFVAFYVMLAGSGFPLDDSWIHQTFGRNLAQHGEWSFIPGQPGAASTSPLYTVLLSVGYAVGVPYALWTHVLGVIALWVAAVLAARMAQRLLPDYRHVDWYAGLAMLTTWHLIWAAASGMETMLFSMLTLLLIYVVWRSWDRLDGAQPQAMIIYGVATGIITALITMARPEGILLGGLCGLAVLITVRKKHLRGLLIYVPAALVAFVLAIAPYLILNLELTGGLLPDTASAKFEQHAILLSEPLLSRIGRLVTAILAGGQVLLVPGMFACALIVSRKGHTAPLYGLPLLWAVALIVLYAVRLPASYQHGRYVIPALPGMVLAGTVGTVYLINRFNHQRRKNAVGRVFIRAALISVVSVQLLFTLLIGATAYARDVRIINEEMVESAHWIRDNLPPDELLAIHDIGAVGYFAPRPKLLDIAGLVSPEVIPIVTDADALWQLMQERDARYLMAFPDQIPGDSTDDPRLCPVYVSDGTATIDAGGEHMAVYRLSWDENCDALDV